MNIKTRTIMTKVQALFDVPTYLVGGCCRDIILGHEPNDYDFASSLSVEDVQEALKGKHRTYFKGNSKKLGTICFKIDGEEIDLTTFRCKEEYSDGSRTPAVEFTSSIDVDLSRRDFTINAIAMRLNKNGNVKIIDPFHGRQDLTDKILRTVGNSKIRFKEDPLRILRAIRFANRFGLEYEEKTADRVRKMAPKLLEVSKERWVQEIDKMLLDKNCKNAVIDLWMKGIFNYLIPELSLQYHYDQNSRYHDEYLHYHTALVLEAAQKAGEPIDVLWACLLHDIAKPFVRTENEKTRKSHYINHEILGAEMADRIGMYLKWSNDRRNIVVELIKNHLKDDCILRPYDNAHKLSLDNEPKDLNTN